MQMPIAAAIGMGVPSLRSPTTAVAAAAPRNWMKPSSDEAAPAIWGNGDIAPAVVPGVMKARETSIRTTGPIRV